MYIYIKRATERERERDVRYEIYISIYIHTFPDTSSFEHVGGPYATMHRHIESYATLRRHINISICQHIISPPMNETDRQTGRHTDRQTARETARQTAP